jgi:formiminotetrahydrofolate cyclodeaminase
MKESLWDQPVLRFREQIAASTPTPGGGAVAAVTATFAAALLQMVCRISLRKTAETKRQEIEAILSRVQTCESTLARYADEDILAFDAYMEARKDDSAVSQTLLLDCARVPMAGAEMVTELQSLLPEIEAVCPAFLSSDLATAMYLLRASRESLLANVKTNLDSLGNGADALELREKCDRLTAQGPPGAVP